MASVTEYFYDDEDFGAVGGPEQKEGDGNLTWIRQHVGGGADDRDTFMAYDYRDRRTATLNPERPYAERIEYDNLDRPIRQALFGPATGPLTDEPAIDDDDRIRYVESDYSQRGLPYRQAVAIDPDPNVQTTFLETHTWYDEVGRAIETWAPSGPATKTSYDGLGRAVVVYTTDRDSDGLPGDQGSYSAAYDSSGHKAVVDDEEIFEQSEHRYIEDENLLDLVTTRGRTHDADDLGDLSDATAEEVIITYMGYEYDGADREVSSINFGTNDGQDRFIHGDIEPSIITTDPEQFVTTSDDLITTTVYNSRGLADR